MIKIAVVGSRSIKDRQIVKDTLAASPWTYSPPFGEEEYSFVSGGADGVDTSAEFIADEHNIPIEVIEPDYDDWSGEHPAKQRNTEIVETADVVVAVWNGSSNGTRDTIDKALDRGVPVYVEVVE